MWLISTVVFILLQFGTRVSSDQAVLEDQPVKLESGSWEWNWRTLKPNTTQDSGWTKSTTTQNPKPRYVTCSTGLPLTQQPNNWLRSKLLLGVSKINRIDITLEYAIRQPCSGSFCTETIDLYVNQSDTYKDTDKYPNPFTNAEAYKKFGSVSRQSGRIQMETVSLPVNTEYILLAFRDEGGCKVLYSVKVTYNFCAKQTLNNSLVSLPKTVAPENDLKPLRVNGSCPEETVPLLSGSVSIQCQSNGNWNESGFEGRCVCKEGTENTGGKCQDCLYGKYNMHKGGNCSLCPANSKSTNDRKSCTCKKTFYRAPDESRTENCTGLPSEPRHAIVVFFNQSTVVLEWSPPENNGGRSDVYYEVECRKPCDEDDGEGCVNKPCADEVDYIPDKKRLNATNVIVTNLFSFVNYTFVIYAKNGISAVASSEDTKFTSLSVRTNGSVPEKPQVSAKWLEDLFVARVSWTLKVKNGVIKEYHVTYTREDDSSDRQMNSIEDKEIDFKNLKGGKTYKFEVTAVNHIGAGPPGVKTLKVPVGGLTKAWFIIAAAGGSGLLVIIVTIIIFIIFCRRHRRNRQKDYMRALERGSEMSPLDQRQYINPDNYVNIMELIAEIATELDRSKVHLEEEIGRGEFADVYKGTLKARQGPATVAVKILRPGSNEKNQKDFLSEASIMGQFKHQNVIELVGVVTKSAPMMIITEFLESGSLEHFLKKRKDQLTSLQLLGMARGVASGMVYLSQMKFIHRDIAARNILVGENMACKVTDFGLSRELAGDGPDSEYETQGGKIPVRWTAPEAIQHRLFSVASDVWSYGILLWEIMSFCDRPYWDWGNFDVLNRVESGYRLPAPKGCPKIVHQLMMDCWDADKDKRPKFEVILSRLDELIRSPEFLKDDLAHLVTAPGEVDFAGLQSVEDWLNKINMGKYSENFRVAQIEDLEQVLKLEDNDLKEMGVSLIGHRSKMTKSITALKSGFSNKAFVEREGAL